MGNLEDLQDMRAFQAGDPEGFRRLFERYGRPLLHYLARITGNRAVAEELVQESFLRVCRAAGTYEPRTAFRAWLYTIATNVARNEMRRRPYKVRTISMAQSAPWLAGGGPGSPAVPETGSPEEMAVARGLEGIIQEGLGRLPEKQRAALLLSRHHGFSYEEIGGVLDLGPAAVKSLIHRATRGLQRHLQSRGVTLAERGGGAR